MVTILITTDALTSDSKFFRESYAFVASRACFGSDRIRSSRAVSVDRRHDVVDAVAIRAHRRSRHTTRDGLSMNALHELRTLALMTLAARRGNIAPRNRRLRISGRKNVVALMAIGTDGSAGVSARNGPGVHALSIRKKRTVANSASLHD